MGNTTFYQDVNSNLDKITWKEILSECRQKHTRADLERAMQAGTSLDTATEATMLLKWKKPWIFFPLLKYGLAFLALLYLTFFITMLLSDAISSATVNMILIIPPLIIPIILMIFLWEMNIPRNISLYELFAFFLIGGFLSFICVSFLFNVFAEPSAANIQTQAQLNEYSFLSALGAALREEPAKLLSGLILLCWCSSKKKKIYGFTGLVIGAAVGAGFGGFESISYAMNTSNSFDMIRNQIIRGVLAVGGHVLYAAPYLAAVALEMRDGQLSFRCFTSKYFLLAFASSCICHLLWNYLTIFGTVWYFICIFIILALWAMLLYITRQCLRQAVHVGRSSSGGRIHPPFAAAAAGALTLQWITGPLQGKVLTFQPGAAVAIGRDPGCQIRLPQGTKGISRRHCSLAYGPEGWTITDLNSTYGTWLGDGRKLAPGVPQVLHRGDYIYLAGKQTTLKIR